MNNWDKFLKTLIKLLSPPPWAVFLMTITAFPLVIYALINLEPTHPIAYAAYVYSAYAFAVLCFAFPKMRRFYHEAVHGDRLKAVVSFRNFMHRYKYTSMFIDDREFRARLALYTGQFINLAYAVFKCANGYIYRSGWLWSVGIYYLMLGITKFFLMRKIRITDRCEHSGNKLILEYKSHRACAVMLILLNLTLSAMAFYMVVQNKSNNYSGAYIYISALYTFYYFINALRNVIRFTHRNPILSAAKRLSLAAALVSVYTLQTAMLNTFGSDAEFRQLMNILTGGAVNVIIIAMAVLMIIKANKKLTALTQTQGADDNG